MLVPLTDPSNKYSSMMLELIADQTPYPSSPLPRRFAEVVEPSMRPGPIVRAVVTTVVIVAVATVLVGAIRALQP